MNTLQLLMQIFIIVRYSGTLQVLSDRNIIMLLNKQIKLNMVYITCLATNRMPDAQYDG